MTNLKIIVDGPFSSGKTTFVRAGSEIKVHSINVVVNVQADYIGMDYGRIEIDGDIALVLLGTPSAKRFLLDWFASDMFMVGYVLMVDSAKPETFREAKAQIEFFAANAPRPFIVVANKQDQAGAWSPDDLRLALKIPPEIPVVPCVATDKESVKRVLVALLDEVLKALAQDNLRA